LRTTILSVSEIAAFEPVTGLSAAFLFVLLKVICRVTYIRKRSKNS
jgi:hypothetical protein